MIARLFDLITTPQTQALPPRTPHRVVLSTLATLVLTGGSLALLAGLLNRPLWMKGLVAAGLISVLATLLSLLPLVWGLKRSLNAATAGYFAAMTVRLLVSLGGCVLAIRVGGYPAGPTLLLMTAFYVAVLAVEATVIGAAAWVAAPVPTNKR